MTPSTTPPTDSREPILRVRDLRVSYRVPGGTVPALRGVDLTVRAGEVVAVVGESGSGKSTAAQAVIGLLPAGGRVEGGTIAFAGREVTALTEREWRDIRGRHIGFVPQDPTVSLNPTRRVGDQIAEVLRVHGLAGRTAARRRAVEVLRTAGIRDPEARARQYPHQFSGGMRQRVLIGIGTAGEPKLLIADEPTSALDVTVQRQILDHIERRSAASGSALLLITHDLAVAADRADTIVVMRRGEVVEVGDPEQILTRPEHPYTRRLVASAPSMASGRLSPGPEPRQSSSTTAAATGGSPATESAGGERSGVILAVRDLVKEFRLPTVGGARSRFRAVDGVSLAVGRGETLGLVGESGSGKSTVARLAVRLERPDAGRIEFDGVDITGHRGERLRQLRRRIQLVYQNPYASLDPRFTIAEVLDEPLRAYRIGDRASRRRRAAELLDLVALPRTLLDRRPAELSGGQRQRVAIGRALAVEPEVVVCDEPVSALDVSVQAQILELLVQLQAELGLSYLFISHDLAVVRQLCDRVAVMRAGQIVEAGETTAVFANPTHEYTRSLLDAIAGRRYRDRTSRVGAAPAGAPKENTHVS
ncbi:peptide/nickel transport system ATP-binding protein [Micromonospora pallida]|uniref:Peptide/nickel transport system ATP-binding protein n=1 Tax=Micromonospora pallida TaxID=145854 RepID=A0A1C6SCF9_9ACTN|nr:ABC transporter ATP-binding protein [Micromonospora pallida]SCL26973.1 peptide/nickel transport system ATP-binding protein [Micromonospora pallida]